MRNLIAVLLAGLVLIPLPARAQSSAQELQALVRHQQAVQEIYMTGARASMEMDRAEALIDLYVEGQVPEADMRSEIAAVRLGVVDEIDEFEGALAQLPPPPSTGDANKDAGLKALEDMVRGLGVHLWAQWGLLERLAATATGGDPAAYAAASADSLALAGVLIDFENVAVEAAMAGADPRHPQRGLYEASIGSNLAMRAALILMEDSLRGNTPRIADAKSGIENGLARSEQGIAAGRRDAAALLAKMEGRRTVSETDRISQKFVADLVGAYGDGFDVEASVVEAMRGFLDSLILAMETRDGGPTEALASAAQTFQADILALMDARFDEQTKRLNLVEDFSTKIAVYR